METDGANTPTEFHCQTVQDAESNARHLVAIDLTRCPADPNALDEAVIDITVTDGSRAWRGEGLTEMSLGNTIPNRMRHALEALVALQPATEEYICRFTPQTDGTLLVEVEWDNKRHGKDIMSRVHLTLDPVKDASLAVRGIMRTLLNQCESFEADIQTLQQKSTTLVSTIEECHKQLAVYTSGKEADDPLVALKVAELLFIAKQAAAEKEEDKMELE